MDEIEALTEQQGWNDHSLLTMALDFIKADEARHQGFVNHLEQVASTENQETYPG